MNIVQKENYTSASGDKFTEEDIAILTKYYIHTDYVNSNIVAFSTDTVEKIVEQDEKLYQDAIEQLYASAHPQYTFQTSQDNLLMMPEFNDIVDVRFGKPDGWVFNNYKNWDQGLWVGNFVRVAIRDDYQVKLRVIRMEFNPCHLENKFDITFSSMVQYKSKRNDFISILNEGGVSNKNAITARYASHAATADSVAISSDMILKILNSSTFTKYMNNANFNGGIANGLSPGAVISVKQISADRAEIDELFAEYVQANKVVAKILEADDAVIENLKAGLIDADHIVSRLLEADEAKITNLFASKGVIDYLESQLVVAGHIDAGELKAAIAEIDTLDADSAFVTYLNNHMATIANASIDTTIIANAVAAKITVADLFGGQIVLSDNMQIVSENGQLAMTGQAIQIGGYDDNGDFYVGIQLGYDTNGNPSLVVRNRDGATVLDANGITSNAIADGLIVNNMIHSGAITEDKLGFSIMKSGD
jgi:hypothetical protein